MEVERKFLVDTPPDVLSGARATEIVQGYLVLGDGGAEARVRRRGGACTLTVKSGRGISRSEAEIELTDGQFEALWPATEGRRVEKVRHELPLPGGLVAELDVYGGALVGLRVVEVEFPSVAAAEAFTTPGWFGVEVTDDDAYKNRRLATDGCPG
ncbi:MAG TPA: CYTH domain-containing protein [Solirubrobacteraceae bacterium]|jgi:CYTH domain-containing protein|nr:CYTH domain-containing protein [Solirubrobacteraceae bacterium]